MTRLQKGHSGGFLCTSHKLMAHSTAIKAHGRQHVETVTNSF